MYLKYIVHRHSYKNLSLGQTQNTGDDLPMKKCPTLKLKSQNPKKKCPTLKLKSQNPAQEAPH